LTDDRAERWLRLKEAAEKQRRENDRAKGRLSLLKEERLKEHGCRTSGEAAKKLAAMEKELKEKRKRFNGLLRKFEKEFGERLER
jgi:hypothetical protein